jgi:probable O-glycosylation ligase (exosortase A-associated)
MRDLIVLLLMLLSIPFTFKRPVVGVLTYAFFSLMNPHRITYGFAGSFPFVMIIAAVTLLATLASKEQKKVPFTPVVVQLLIVILWVTLTAAFALNQVGAWEQWSIVMKTMLIVVLTIAVTRTVNDVKALVLTVAVSLGFWGFKGGLWTIASGGHNGLLGPPGTYIGDNNTLALAMVTTVPLIVAVASFAPTKWTKRAAIAVAVLTGISVVGSYSRGALLGGTMMALFLWLKSRSKVKTGMLFALAIPLLLAAMPPEWMDRMHSIDNYKEDASALGRINSWGFAINVANHLPLGGGFATFTPQIFQLYAPDPTVFFVAHSIYFQVLGEHGYIGLFLYLLMFFFAWRTGSRIVKKCGKDPELAWAATTARMCQVSIIGFMTAGAFLAMAYYDLPYYVLTILVCLEKVLFIAPQPDNTPPLRLAFLSRRKSRARAWKEPAPAQAKAPATRKR